jgi:hypothetical protein
MTPTLRRLTASALALAALSLPALLLANMANPIQEGDRVGEPSGALRDVHVVGERLHVDLRPLERGETAKVEAVYRLRNDGPARALELVFVADALADSGGVWLDGRPVASTAGTAELPQAWRAPASTPGFDGGDVRYSNVQWGPDGDTLTAPVLRFSLALAPGAHEVRVAYRAEATRHSLDSPALYWQLAYILAPARQWASFGTLEARVDVPEGWSAAAAPAMRRDGDALVGSWRGVPADALALTAQAPVPDDTLPWMVFWATAAGALVGMLWLADRVGRWLGRRGRTVAWALLPALGLAATWSIATLMGMVALPGLIQGELGAQRAWGYGYGTGMAALFSLPLLFLASTVVAFAASFRAHRRVRPSPPPPA